MIINTRLEKLLCKNLFLYLPGSLNSNNVPSIDNVIASSITDTSFVLSADVTANGKITTVEFQYGLTTLYGSTAIPLGSPIEADSTATLSVTLSGLLPYKRYFYRVVATNSSGSTIIASNVMTVEPSELTDGNWYAQFDFDADTNVVDGSNRVSQFRDNFQDNAEGTELIPNGDMSSSTGWSLNGMATISGGVMNFAATTYGSVWRGDSTNNRYKVYNTRFDIVSITSGTLRVNHANPVVDFTTSGSKAVLGHISDGTYLMRLQGYPAATAVIDNASQKRVLGNHLIQWTDANKPTKDGTHILFNGTTHWLRNAVEAGLTVGTIYALVQRIGTDTDYVMRNNLTGLGEYAGNYLRLGSNQAGNTWYNFRIKKLYIRSVTDSAGTIDKLNEYLSRNEVPTGVTPFGIYSNTAIFDNNAIWNNGN